MISLTSEITKTIRSTKVNAKGGTTCPVAVRQRLGFKKDEEGVLIWKEIDGKIIIEKG